MPSGHSHEPFCTRRCHAVPKQPRVPSHHPCVAKERTKRLEHSGGAVQLAVQPESPDTPVIWDSLPLAILFQREQAALFLWQNKSVGLQPASNSIQSDSKASRALKGCPLRWQSNSISVFMKVLWAAQGRRVLALLSHATQEAASVSRAATDLCFLRFPTQRHRGRQRNPCLAGSQTQM